MFHRHFTVQFMSMRNGTSAYKPSKEEQQLVSACLSGDKKAQKALYDKYKDAMYTLTYRITSDHVLAQDALQEAFVGVFRGLHRFRSESTLGAWIKTIVIRHAYKRIKQEWMTISIEEYQVPEKIVWHGPLDAEYLEKAIQGLPSGYRSVFILIEIEGFQHKEVAEMLGISTGTSKSQLFHAKKLLKKRLKQMTENV